MRLSPHAPLSVAYDATLWDEPTTGIGLYTRELGRALESEGIQLELLGAARTGESSRTLPGRTAFTLAELPRVLAQRPEPLFHAVANFNLPLQRVAGKRFVLTVHDLIPVLLPETVSRPFRWQFDLWLSRSLKLADRVICVSERTAEDLRTRYDVPDGRLHVVHNGVDHVYRVPSLDDAGREWLSSLALPGRFLLYVGALDARKNVATVLEAVDRLHAAGAAPTLVLAGQRWFGSGPVERRVEELVSRGVDVRPLGYLEAPRLYALMRRASAFVFPSLYEGFGLPPLEAMALGVPTVISGEGALPEVCGDGALQVPAKDPAALAAALGNLLRDASERAALAAAGRRRAARFTWGAAARATAQVYRAALEGPGAPA